MVFSVTSFAFTSLTSFFSFTSSCHGSFACHSSPPHSSSSTSPPSCHALDCPPIRTLLAQTINIHILLYSFYQPRLNTPCHNEGIMCSEACLQDLEHKQKPTLGRSRWLKQLSLRSSSPGHARGHTSVLAFALLTWLFTIPHVLPETKRCSCRELRGPWLPLFLLLIILHKIENGRLGTAT